MGENFQGHQCNKIQLYIVDMFGIVPRMHKFQEKDKLFHNLALYNNSKVGMFRDYNHMLLK